MASSFDFGDELPEIQLKFRESVDYGHNLERISKYILNIDEFNFRENFQDYRYVLNQSTDKFRKYKETFKIEIEDDFIKYSDKLYNQNSLSDIYKNNDKNTYFLEPLFGITTNNLDNLHISNEKSFKNLNNFSDESGNYAQNNNIFEKKN
jgi:hypothetical protein